MNDAPRKKTLQELKNEAIAETRTPWLRRSRQDTRTNQGTTKAASQKARFNKTY